MQAIKSLTIFAVTVGTSELQKAGNIFLQVINHTPFKPQHTKECTVINSVERLNKALFTKVERNTRPCPVWSTTEEKTCPVQRTKRAPALIAVCLNGCLSLPAPKTHVLQNGFHVIDHSTAHFVVVFPNCFFRTFFSPVCHSSACPNKHPSTPSHKADTHANDSLMACFYSIW